MDVEIVELQGHIIDSLILPRVLDEIVEAGVDYTIAAFEIGKGHDDPSFARIELRAERGALDRLLVRLADLGAMQPDTGDARLTPADADGVFPEDFYSTTNLPTQVRVDGAWIDVENPEMDCAIFVSDGRARTVAMSDAREGDKIVCGHEGIKVSPLERPRTAGAVKTASVWQVREPLYRRASGRARHYSQEVAPLRAYLSDLLPAGEE